MSVTSNKPIVIEQLKILSWCTGPVEESPRMPLGCVRLHNTAHKMLCQRSLWKYKVFRLKMKKGGKMKRYLRSHTTGRRIFPKCFTYVEVTAANSVKVRKNTSVPSLPHAFRGYPTSKDRISHINLGKRLKDR